MFLVKSKYDLPCNIAQALNIIGDRWTLLIIHEILIGRTTFNDIKKGLNGISANLLSERLKHLVEEGLVYTELYTEHPPRYRYTLTKSGEDLKDVLNALIIWGTDHLDQCFKKLIHVDTGDEVGIAYYSKRTGKLIQGIEAVSIDKEKETV